MVETHPLAVLSVHIDALKPHPQNYRQHSDEQLEHLQQSILENGFYRNIVVANDYTILAGHGVWMAAKRAGIDAVPVVVLPYGPDSNAARKVLVLDNTITRLAFDDDSMLAELLQALRDDPAAGLVGTGYDDTDLAALKAMASLDVDDVVARGESDVDASYSRVVESPVYQITGVCPDVADLIDTTRFATLIDDIEDSDQPQEIKRFLRYAASRHVRFDYGAIAEFYAHADADVQSLMEESALVILDAGRAIELGFAKLADDLRDIAEDADRDAGRLDDDDA